MNTKVCGCFVMPSVVLINSFVPLYTNKFQQDVTQHVRHVFLTHLQAVLNTLRLRPTCRHAYSEHMNFFST